MAQTDRVPVGVVGRIYKVNPSAAIIVVKIFKKE